jgi:WD40 repeat protein
MARIFISHSSRDNEAAARIETWLKSQGFETTFLDFDKTTGIPPGADWEKTLYREVEQSQAVIIIQTPDWMASKWCFVEFTQARALGKAIFPVIEAPTGDTLISPDIQTLNLLSDREGGLERLKRELVRIALDAQGGFEWDASRPPFPGLLSFQEEDAAIYFGRDDDIRRLIERCEARRAQGGAKLIALLGSSGSGKSSLLRAGVIPRLKRAGRNWVVTPPMRPRLRPVDELAVALAAASGPGADWRKLKDDLLRPDPARVLTELANELRVKASAGEAQILIPIDQAEELFGVADPGEAQRFLEILSQALSESVPFMAIMAIRSDFLGQLQSAAALTARFEEFSLGPLPLARIPLIIRGPAKVAGVDVEEAFVQEAARDAATEDALPLLAFALRQLWDRSSNKVLSLDGYKALGDEKAGLTPLENAVRQAADAVLAEANPADDELMALRQAFVPAMVRVNDQSEYVRRPARWDALPPKSYPLLEQLAKARLLIVRQDGNARVVEVAHEALLRKWPRLRSWLDAAREFLIGKQQLEQDLRDWDAAAERDKAGALLTGLKLNRARGWLVEHPTQLTPADKHFIELSLAHDADERSKQEKLRRDRRRAIGVAIFGVLAVSLLALGGALWQSRETQRREASVMTSVADRAIAEADFERAMRAALPILPAPLRFFGWSAPTAVRIPTELGWSDIEVRFLEARLAGAAQLAPFRFELAGHGDVVSSASFSPDPRGARIVTSSNDRTARVWDSRNGSELFQLRGHTGELRTAAFNRDGSRIVTASNDGTARIWDANTQKLLLTLEGHKGWVVFSAAFDRNGTRIVTSSTDGTTRIWDAQTGGQLALLTNPGGEVFDAAFNPDGKRVVTASKDGVARVWDVESKAILPLNGHGNTVRRASFSPNGSLVLTASYDKTARIWDAEKGTELVQINGHRLAVRGAAFSPDGQKIVTASDDGIVRLWDASNISEKREIWDEKSARMLRQLPGHGSEVVAAEFSPDGERIVSASEDGTARVWLAESTPEVHLILAEKDRILDAEFSPDGKQIATASVDNTAQVYDATSGRQLHSLNGHQGIVRSIVFADNGALIISASEDRTVRFWNAGTGMETESRRIEAPEPLYGADMSLDGRRIVGAAASGEVLVWDAATRAALRKFKGHTGKVLSAAFDRNGRRIVTASEDGTAKVWDVETGTMLGEFKGSDPIWSATFSRDGGHILTGAWDRTARIWDVKSGAMLVKMDHPGIVFHATFSPDGERVITATGSGDDRVRVWDARSGALVVEIKGHRAAVRHASFSPNGKEIVTASEDMTARIWDAKWVATLHGEQLERRGCAQRLVGHAQRFSARDVAADPALGTLVGRDVCAAFR